MFKFLVNIKRYNIFPNLKNNKSLHVLHPKRKDSGASSETRQRSQIRDPSLLSHPWKDLYPIWDRDQSRNDGDQPNRTGGLLPTLERLRNEPRWLYENEGEQTLRKREFHAVHGRSSESGLQSIRRRACRNWRCQRIRGSWNTSYGWQIHHSW